MALSQAGRVSSVKSIEMTGDRSLALAADDGVEYSTGGAGGAGDTRATRNACHEDLSPCELERAAARDERDEDTQVSRVAIVRIRRIRSHVCSMGDNDDACAR